MRASRKGVRTHRRGEQNERHAYKRLHEQFATPCHPGADQDKARAQGHTLGGRLQPVVHVGQAHHPQRTEQVERDPNPYEDGSYQFILTHRRTCLPDILPTLRFR